MSASRKARGGVSFLVAPPPRPSPPPIRIAYLAVAAGSLALWAAIIGGVGRLVGWW